MGFNSGFKGLIIINSSFVDRLFNLYWPNG